MNAPYRASPVVLVYRPWWRRVLFVWRHPRWWQANAFVLLLNGLALAIHPRLPWWYVSLQTMLAYGVARFNFRLGDVFRQAHAPVAQTIKTDDGAGGGR